MSAINSVWDDSCKAVCDKDRLVSDLPVVEFRRSLRDILRVAKQEEYQRSRGHQVVTDEYGVERNSQ